VRLFVADETGVGYGAEAVDDTALSQHVLNFAIGIGYDCDPVLLTDLAKLLGGTEANRVPVSRVANAGDESIADSIHFIFIFIIFIREFDLRKQLRVEHPPKAVVGAAIFGHQPVELVLGTAFQIAQMLGVQHDAAFDERRVNALAIGKQQCVTHIEEDKVNFRVH
jgi:hypothetical protein